MTKIQSLRAIHNPLSAAAARHKVVSGWQRYKVWEQFTTAIWHVYWSPRLFQDDKDTKFESNSQHMSPSYEENQVVSGWQRYKVWEQFTTHALLSRPPTRLFQDDKDTKFESNSQLAQIGRYFNFSCFRMTKIQSLRAIHNVGTIFGPPPTVVSGWQRYKVWEQFTTNFIRFSCCSLLFQDDKDTKFESNSQPSALPFTQKGSCFRMTKIQSLRAIHNAKVGPNGTTSLFQDDKDTKFESNSQHFNGAVGIPSCCFRMTKIQSLRAIHNLDSKG